MNSNSSVLASLPTGSPLVPPASAIASAQMSGMGIFGLVYRERAAKIAHELAQQREKGSSSGAGKAPGEQGSRNTGPLTLPGWGREHSKRKYSAEVGGENDAANVKRFDSDEEDRPLPPMPKSVSVSSLSDLVSSFTKPEASLASLAKTTNSATTPSLSQVDQLSTRSVSQSSTEVPRNQQVSQCSVGGDSDFDDSDEYDSDSDSDDYDSEEEKEDKIFESEVARLQKQIAEARSANEDHRARLQPPKKDEGPSQF